MHNCPECGNLCTCDGDIDDLVFNDGAEIGCECCDPNGDEDESWRSTHNVCAMCEDEPVIQDDSYSGICDRCARILAMESVLPPAEERDNA